MREITDKLTGSLRGAQNAGKMGRFYKSDRWFDGLEKVISGYIHNFIARIICSHVAVSFGIRYIIMNSFNKLQEKIVILGAGIAGIAAAYKLGEMATIYEARDRFGGLCDNFLIDGFRFDYAVHLSFTTDEIVRSVFDHVKCNSHRPEAYNYCDGYWAKHPVQNNTYTLPINEKINIIKSFIEREDELEISNYNEWLQFQYGNYFAKKYPARYTRKYWCCEAEELTVDWIKNRMYKPSLDEVLYGALTDETPITYYANEMRYPEYGGFRAFFEPIANKLNIRLSHRAIEIDISKKQITFTNGLVVSYDKLISSLPLPIIISIIKQCPEEVKAASENLYATSICLISIGFNKEVWLPSLWFYVYNEEIPFARAYSPSMKSVDNVPERKSSLQFEIYYTTKKPLNLSNDDLIKSVVDSLKKLKIASEQDIQVIDIRHIEYGNVVFYHGMEQDRKTVLDYLMDCEIKSIGRFGEWDYLWSDQSFLSGFLVSRQF